jgi:O-antigen/teichoic acid export membrane protein
VGKIKTTFKLMVMWTSLSWLLIPYLALKANFIGASFGYFLVSVSSVVAYFILKKIVNFDGFYSIGKPFISSLAMLATLLISKRFNDGNTWLGFFVLIFLGGVSYLGTLYLLTGKVFLEDVKKTFANIINR